MSQSPPIANDGSEGRKDGPKGDPSAEVIPLRELIIEGAAWPLVPDAEYDALLTQYQYARMRQFGGAYKVYLHFRLHDAGEHSDKVLYRAYRAKGMAGSRLVLGRRSDLVKTMCRLLETPEHRYRLDRVSLRDLRHKLYRVTTRTVTEDYRGKPMPTALHYSVIDDIRYIVGG